MHWCVIFVRAFNPCAVLCEPNISSTILSSIPNKLWKFWLFIPNQWGIDLEIGPYSGEFDQAFLKKSNARGFSRGGGWLLLELTQTLLLWYPPCVLLLKKHYCLAIVFSSHKGCMHNALYGWEEFSQDILLEFITGIKNGSKYHLKTTQGCIEVYTKKQAECAPRKGNQRT